MVARTRRAARLDSRGSEAQSWPQRACARGSACRSSWRAGCGGCWACKGSSRCRRIPRRGWPGSPSWSRRRSVTRRPDGTAYARRRAGRAAAGRDDRRPRGATEHRCSRRSRRRPDGCFPPTSPSSAATNPATPRQSWPPGAGLAIRARSAAGSPGVGETSPRSSSTLAAWRGWTVTRTPLAASAADARDRGIRSSVGAPISVEGRVWGVIIAASTRPSRCRRARRRASRRSPNSSGPRSPMPRPAWNCAATPPSRPRCGGSRRWSPGGRPRGGVRRGHRGGRAGGWTPTTQR